MDLNPLKNPFSPGAGTPPYELVGREGVIEQCEILIERILRGRPEKSMLLTGLRGVGKTVLLNRMESLAENAGYQTIQLEAHEGKLLSELLAPQVRKLLYKLNRIEGAKSKFRRALGVLKSFVGSIKVSTGDIEIGLDIDPEAGAADSGDIEIDLPDLLVALAEVAQDRKTAVGIFIDEVQYFTERELSALIMGMHKMQQRQLPLIFIGAGLPILPRLAGESKSYAERLFDFPKIGPLSKEDAMKAIREPILDEGAEIRKNALNQMAELTQGYPYFIQEWGYQTWRRAERSPITIKDVNQTTEHIEKRLDENFFRVRFDRLTPSEKKFLRAMAELGVGPYRIGDIADCLKVKVGALSPRRAKLINKGMIYSPKYGDLEFTVPLFEEFMIREMPKLKK